MFVRKIFIFIPPFCIVGIGRHGEPIPIVHRHYDTAGGTRQCKSMTKNTLIFCNNHARGILTKPKAPRTAISAVGALMLGRD